MDLSFKEIREGLKVNFKDKDFYLRFPLNIWQSYPEKIKEVLFDNLAHLLTICMPIVAGLKKVEYNTAEPYFKNNFKNIILKDIPSAIEEYKGSAKGIIKRFLEVEYIFNKNKIKIPVYAKYDFENRAIIPFSCGKDTLLSLGICNEINLNPVLVYINDTISPNENKRKIIFIRKIAKEFNLNYNVVRNELENLNDFEFWKKPESCLSYSHMITSFNFLMLPFTHFYKAKYIIQGNEHNLDYQFMGKEGHRCYISYDQSSEGMKNQNKMLSLMTNDNVKLSSIIKPLSDLALIKILHKRYPNFAKYQISCDNLDNSKDRWCQHKDCVVCAGNFLFTKAVGFNPKDIGLNKNFFDKKFSECYSLFCRGKDREDKIKEAFEEELFAFYLAYKNKAKGYLIDQFKKKYLREVSKREDEFYNKFFKIYKADIPKEIKNKVLSIYKEELSKV